VPGRLFILLIFSSSLFAQAAYFGDRVPLTNTRYGAMSGRPVLVTSGANTFAFISTGHDVRMAGAGDAMARPVLEASDGDAVWTGSHFFVAGTSRGSVVARLVDANGNGGATFTLVERGSKPRLAFDGERIVLLYENGGLRSVQLTGEGAVSGTDQLLASSVRDFDVAGNAVLLATDEGLKLVTLTPTAALGAETHVSDVKAHAVSLASSGANALALWSRDGGIDASLIANGVAGQAFAIAEPASSPSASWNGSDYHAAFVANGAMRVARVDGSARTAAAVNLALNAAAEQSLVDAVSTPNASLLVWNESGDARIGIRARNGAWRERLLASNEEAVAAATDGQSFVVLTENESGWSAAFLDENGALLRQSSRINAFRARDVALANDAMVIGNVGGSVVAARISRDGSVAAAVTLNAAAEDPVIASDGTNFVAAWETAATSIEAVVVGSDAPPALVAASEGADPAVAFNGSHYVFAWREGDYVRARRVTTAGERIPEVVQISRPGGTAPSSIRLSSLGSGIGLTWHDGRAQLAHFDFATAPWEVKTALGFETPFIAAPRMLGLPNGGVAFLQSEAGGEPHQGSARVSMAIAHAAPAVAPAAPQAAASFEGGKVRVSWTAPAQPVSGYRVEYSVDRGPWLEAEEWADGDGTSLSFSASRTGMYALRVRAWGDGGTSAYSAPVEVTVTSGGRRRAVR
jgi:hypothetical protein